MNAQRFKRHESAANAASWGCFQCCGPLPVDSLRDDGYPNGRYSLMCSHCCMRTWFDLNAPPGTCTDAGGRLAIAAG